MRKFIIRLFAFLFPALLILAAVEIYVRHLPNTYRYKDQWMWQNGQRVHTLILGNSHAYYDLCPKVMGDSIFNLGNVSQRLEHDLHLLRRYAEACPNLRTVIQVADNSNVFDAPMEEDEPGRATYYQLYMGYRKHSPLSRYGFELASMTSFWGKMQKSPLFSSSVFAGSDARTPAPLECDSLGWGTAFRSDLCNPDDFLPERINQHLLTDSAAWQSNKATLQEIAAECQRRHLKLVLLMTPVSEAYTRKASKSQLAAIQQWAHTIKKSHPNVQVADYSQDRRFTKEDFFDSDHLNDRGAKKFSEIYSTSSLWQQ